MGLEVELSLKYCRNGGKCRSWGINIQAPIDEEASSIPVGQNGSETQSCMRTAGRLSIGLDLPSGNCWLEATGVRPPKISFSLHDSGS